MNSRLNLRVQNPCRLNLRPKNHTQTGKNQAKDTPNQIGLSIVESLVLLLGKYILWLGRGHQHIGV